MVSQTKNYVFHPVNDTSKLNEKFIAKKTWEFNDTNFNESGLILTQSVRPLAKPTSYVSKYQYYYSISRSFYDRNDQFYHTNGQARYLYDSASILAIPQNYIGNGISPGTLTITDRSSGSVITIVDDKKGNLIDTSLPTNILSGSTHDKYTNQVGNVFYNTGHIVITDNRPKYNSVLFGYTGSYSANRGFELEYKSEIDVYENEVYCEIPAGKYSMTLNPSVRVSQSFDQSAAAPFTTGSAWSPYATGIGLYDDDNNLVITGKFSAPLKMTNDMDITLVIRFDF